MLQPKEWPLVRDYGFKVLLLLSDPYSLKLRRFHEKYQLDQKRRTRSAGQNADVGVIHIVRVDAGPFEADEGTVPFVKEFSRHDDLDMLHCSHDLSKLDEYLKSWVPEDLDTIATSERWILLDSFRLITSKMELIQAAHKVVFAATTEELLFMGYSTSTTSPWRLGVVVSTLHCYPLGCQFEPRCGRGFRRVMPYAV